ncbi:tandem-95 repeat protein, partial [Georgenia ruanii]|nr:tandem-95 repeat protein [Georgenia ruanii]
VGLWARLRHPAPAGSRRAARRRASRRRTASIATLSLALSGVVVAGVLYDGVATADVDLNDGGVWVTSSSQLRVGRVNYPVQQLDGAVTATSPDLDVLQEGQDVFVVDHGAGVLQRLDPTTVSTTGEITLPARRVVALGGGVVAVLDVGTGALRTAPAAAVAALAEPDAPAPASLGPDAVMTVGKDGTAYGVSIAEATLVTVPKGSEPREPQTADEDPPAPPTAGLGVAPATLDRAATQVTAVGDEPVVLAHTDKALLLLRPDRKPVDLTGLGLDTTAVALQLPSGPGDDVVLATADALVRVPLDRGQPEVVPAGVLGPPAAPVVVGGCAHAAWAGGRPLYLRQCDGAAPTQAEIPTAASAAELSFRTNRDLVVLNDTLSGSVYLVNDAMTIVDNWEDVTPPEADDTQEQESQQNLTAEVPLDREAENRPPVAQDDRLGVRPGSTTVLELLANDTDPDGDLLTITAFDDAPATLGTVRSVLGGRALQVEVPADAAGGATLAYTVDDGRGGQAQAVATVTVVPPGANTAPEQVRPTTLTLTAGATGSLNVLADMRDPDGDPLVVTGAAWTSDDVVRHSPDGVLTFEDTGTAPGRKEVVVTVSDGRASTDVVVGVDVRADAGLPPVPVFDYVTATAGRPVVVAPVANDTDPDGESLRLANVTGGGDVRVVPDYDAGTFQFTSDAPGAHYLTYVVVDDGGASATGLVRVEVTEAGQGAPVAVRDAALLPAGGTALVDVLANDEDPAGGLLAVQQVEVPEDSGLAVAVLEHRLLKITARHSLPAATSVRYTVAGENGRAQGEVVVLPVAPDPAAPPDAQPDVANVRAGDVVTIPVLQNDTHPAGLDLTLTGLTETPEQGLFFVAGDTVRVRAPAQPGTLSAVYTVTDAAGVSDSARITVHVQADTATNSAPLPAPVETRAFAGERVRIPVPLYGVDPDGDSVQLLGTNRPPELGRIVEVGPSYLDYEAYGHAAGTDTFSYTVRDRLGLVATADVRVGVVPAPDTNGAPQAADDRVDVRPGRAVEVDVLANDTDPDGDALTLAEDAPVEPVEGLDVTARDGQVQVTAPDRPGTFPVVYHVTDGRGGRDSGVLIVHVAPDAPLRPPLARDDLVEPADILEHDTVTVPVLDNDDDPDGTAAALDVSLPDAPAGVRVVGDRVQAPVLPARQLLTYQVTDVDGNTAYAFVDIPGVADTGPILRTDADPVEVTTGETVRLSLADHVVSPSGRPVRLAETGPVTATGSDGEEARVDGITLEFTSAPGFAGPASLTFEVTDAPAGGEGLSSVLTLPITVMPDGGNTPPTIRGTAVQVAPAEEPTPVNLAELVEDPDAGDFRRLDYRLESVPEGFDARLEGPFLTVAATAGAAVGTTGDVVVSVADPVNAPVLGRVSAEVVASTRDLPVAPDVDLGTVDQGETVTADVLVGAFNPFPETPLRVVDARVEAGDAGVATTAAGVRVTPDAGFVGRAVVRYTLQDATGDPQRQAEGRVTMQVVGVPERPAPPRVEEVRDGAAVLSWTAPNDNGAPVTAYTVRTNGTATRCASTTCTVTGLTNGVAYTFTVSATNEAGDSAPSAPSAPARPDVRPERPAPPVVAFGDGELRVTWRAPANAGSPVESYDLQMSPAAGAGQVRVSGTTHTWTGLTNGQEYRVRLRAHNAAPEPSEWSGWSAGVVPAGVPAAPQPPRLDRVDNPTAAQVQGSWRAPDAHGAPVSEYRATIYRDGAPFRELTVPGTTTSVTADAPPGAHYTMTVAARNKAGWGPASQPSQKVRTVLRPGAPGAVTATPTGQDGEVRLSFPDAADHGEPLLGYQVKVSGGTLSLWQPLAPDRTVRGLVDGASYTFRVRAVNLFPGDESAPSNPAVPFGPLADPTLTAAGTPGAVTVRWAAPDPNGRRLTATELRVRGADGGWGPWQAVGAIGERAVPAPPSATLRAEVRVTREDGARTTAAAEARAGDPRVAVSRTRTASGQPGCAHPSCAYLDAEYWHLPAGEYTATFYASREGLRPVATVAGRLEGHGVLQSGHYRGYPNETVRVELTGPGVRESASLTWPGRPVS